MQPRSNRKPLFSLVGILGVIAALWAIGSVTAATKAVPSNTSPPTITGKAEVGQTLTVNKGTWAGTSPISYEYQWRRCDEQGASCAAIAGADDQTYVLKQVDSGNTLRVRVVARNAEGSDTRITSPTEVVKPATTPPPPPNPTPSPSTGCPKQGGKIEAKDVAPPARLLIDRTFVQPNPLTHGTRTVTARFHVSACGGADVQGALVYVTAVPYRQFSIPNEQATGSDGWATLTFQALSGYPVSPRQQLIVMFVRARKSSEPLLGGISTRRLVSFRVTR